MYENPILKTINKVVHRQNFAPTLRALTEDEQAFASDNVTNWLTLDSTNSESFSAGRKEFMSNYLTPDSESASVDFVEAIMPIYKKVPLSAAFQSYKENNPNCLPDMIVTSQGQVSILERTSDFETLVSKLSFRFSKLSELQLDTIIDFISSFEKIGLLLMEPLIISIIGVPLYLTTMMLPLHRTGALLKVIQSIKSRAAVLKIPAILKNALRRASMMLTNYSSATAAIISITGTYLLTTLNMRLDGTYSRSLSLPTSSISLPGPARGPEAVESLVNNVSTGLEIIGGYAFKLSTSVIKGYVLNAGEQVQEVVKKAASGDSKG